MPKIMSRLSSQIFALGIRHFAAFDHRHDFVPLDRFAETLAQFGDGARQFHRNPCNSVRVRNDRAGDDQAAAQRSTLNRNQIDARGNDLLFCQFDAILLLVGRFRGRLSLFRSACRVTPGLRSTRVGHQSDGLAYGLRNSWYQARDGDADDKREDQK